MKKGLFSVTLALGIESVPHNINLIQEQEKGWTAHTHTHLRLVVGLNKFTKNT
jgi:hypothetical protein